ncbi:MAG: oligosaccharide flippase family protein [Pseudomonadota bacterium]|nr:oligosaccharide flippase family protein [Pseudomonadota bacterium]
MSTTRNAIWLTGCRLTGDVLNLLLFVLISRSFGPAGAGAYSYGFAVATFAFVIGCLGIEEYGLRQYARMDTAGQSTFLGELLGTQMLMVALAVISLVVYLALTAPSQATLVMVCALGAYQITAAVVATLFIPAMAAQRMIWPALAELTARTVAFAAAGYAIGVAHAPLAQAVLGYPVAALVWLTIAFRSIRRFAPSLHVSFSPAGTRRILGILWSFALLEIFAQLFARIGVITLSLQIGDAAAGIFATGLRLIEVALMPLSFLGVAAYPRLSQLFSTDLPVFRRSASDLMWLMLLGGVAASWGLYFIAPPLLVPVLGERFAGAESMIQTMAIFALVQAVEACLGRILLTADRQIANATFVAVGAILSVALNLVLVPHFGVSGAIYAGAGAYAAIDVCCIGALRRALTGAVLLRMFASLGIAVALGAGITAWLAQRNFSAWPQAVAAATVFIAVGGLAYRRRHVDDPSGPRPWSIS